MFWNIRLQEIFVFKTKFSVGWERQKNHLRRYWKKMKTNRVQDMKADLKNLLRLQIDFFFEDDQSFSKNIVSGAREQT